MTHKKQNRSTRRSRLRGEILETRRVLTAVYGPALPSFDVLALVDDAAVSSQSPENNETLLRALILDTGSGTEPTLNGHDSLSSLNPDQVFGGTGGELVSPVTPIELWAIDDSFPTASVNLARLAPTTTLADFVATNTIQPSQVEVTQASTLPAEPTNQTSNAAVGRQVALTRGFVTGLDITSNHRPTTYGLAETVSSAESNPPTTGGLQLLMPLPSVPDELPVNTQDTLPGRQLDSGPPPGGGTAISDLKSSTPDNVSEPMQPEFGVTATRPPVSDGVPPEPGLNDSGIDADVTTLDIAANHRTLEIRASEMEVHMLAQVTAEPGGGPVAAGAGNAWAAPDSFGKGIQPQLSRHHQISIDAVRVIEFITPSVTDVSDASETDVGDLVLCSVFGPLVNGADLGPAIEQVAVAANEAEAHEEIMKAAEALEERAMESSVVVPGMLSEPAARRWQTVVDVLLAGATGAMIYSAKLDRETAAKFGALANRFQLRPPKNS